MTPRRLLWVLCLAEVASMVGITTFPSLQPTLSALWGLSHTEVGWINGVYYAGYLLAVPVLASLTDRMPPRRIYYACMILSAVAGLGFASLAAGFWTATLFRGLAGVGLAGTYMPGLKLLGDHLDAMAPGRDHSRAIAFYTASFGVGSALSYYLAGVVAAAADWRSAFVVAGVGPLVALVIARLALPADDPPSAAPETRLLDFRPVLASRRAMGFVLAYTAHNFELFAFRSWIVSYLVFAAAAGPTGDLGLGATAIAAAANLMGLPASVLGNELARRLGRVRTITAVMLSSALLAGLLGFAATLPFWAVAALVLLYGVLVSGDSASITAGVVAAAPAGYRGATMAVHASVGFTGAFLGPLVFGVALDLARAAGDGGESVAGWVAAFAVSGVAVALGPLALARLRR